MPGGSGPGTCHLTDLEKSGIFCAAALSALDNSRQGAVPPEKARSTVGLPIAQPPLKSLFFPYSFPAFVAFEHVQHVLFFTFHYSLFNGLPFVSPSRHLAEVYDNGTSAQLAYFSRETSGRSLASWMPARFSVQLGVGAQTSAWPFCPSCLGASQHYENNGIEKEP